jgi:putative transposase
LIYKFKNNLFVNSLFSLKIQKPYFFHFNLSRKSKLPNINLILQFYFMKIEYNNLYTHFIFTTLHRIPLIQEDNRSRIEKYITGIVNHLNCKMYAIYANPEHVHYLVSRSPDMDEERLAGIIETSSNNFINENKLCIGKFQWQDSCSAFSVSKSDVNKVCKYILNQKEHHHKQTFTEDYEAFVKFYQQTIGSLITK